MPLRKATLVPNSWVTVCTNCHKVFGKTQSKVLLLFSLCCGFNLPYYCVFSSRCKLPNNLIPLKKKSITVIVAETFSAATAQCARSSSLFITSRGGCATCAIRELWETESAVFDKQEQEQTIRPP